MKFEIFRGGFIRRRWYFRLRSFNGEIVAQSEGYVNKADAAATIESIRSHSFLAEVEDLS